MTSKNGSKPATRADLDNVETALSAKIHKVDEKINRVAAELVRTRDEMATKTDISRIEKHLNRITNTLDVISGQTLDNRRTLLVYDKILGEHGQRLESHEKRLAAAESRT